jgi:outer membrane protein OmpA-like peptidoglycan-associated protein
MKKLLLLISVACLLAPTGALAQSAGLSSYTLTAQVKPAHYVVLFALGKATLDATAKSTIAAAAQEFQRTGAASIAVAGHTDTRAMPTSIRGYLIAASRRSPTS